MATIDRNVGASLEEIAEAANMGAHSAESVATYVEARRKIIGHPSDDRRAAESLGAPDIDSQIAAFRRARGAQEPTE